MKYKIDFDGKYYVLKTNDGSRFSNNFISVSFKNLIEAAEYLVIIDPTDPVEISGDFGFGSD